MGPGQDRTRDPCICSQTRICRVYALQFERCSKSATRGALMLDPLYIFKQCLNSYVISYNFILTSSFFLQLAQDFPNNKTNHNHKDDETHENNDNNHHRAETSFFFCGIFSLEQEETTNKIILTLNAPTATKVVCFSHLLKCLRSLYGKQTVWTQIRLLLWEQSVLGPHCLLLYLIRQ